LAVAALSSLAWVSYAMQSAATHSSTSAAHGDDSSTRLSGDSTAVPSESPTRYSVSIRKPAGPPRVAIDQTDAHGNQLTVACSTCHATRNPDFGNKTSADLKEFHRGLPFSHGQVSCLSCHNENNYDTLKLADGAAVEFTNVMRLCAQCHGPQMKDYEHGAHGGMNGYWDLTRGPRTKNNCVDCHHPHTPQFPEMQPTFKPQDRFLDSQGATH